MKQSNPPSCIGCKEKEHMVLETNTLSMNYWHCEYCGTKTRQATTFGKIRPAIGVVTLVLFGIKIS